MQLDLSRFYQACNPKKTLNTANPEDRQYYIDFAPARGGKIISELERTITRLSPEEPTCQLFAGHIGCGKSTELLRLKYELEQQEFHVAYFESSKDLIMADVDVTDILLAIARQVSESLEEANIRLQPKGFKALLQGAVNLLQTEIDLSEGEFSLSLGLGKITAKTKNSTELRNQLRQYLEPRTDGILESINKELLEPAIAELKRRGKKGLVTIVDNLDRVHNSTKSGRPQPEYLFVDRGEQLSQLECHLVYTIPLVLTFSNDLGRLTNRFGIDPKVLPMVQVQFRDRRESEQGMALLRQMVLARAFPELSDRDRLGRIAELFDEPETLDRLCRISGGHVRKLLVILYSCLQKEDPPISRNCLEQVIRRERDTLIRAVTDDEWELIVRVAREQVVKGEIEYQTLLRSMFVFEYQDDQEAWFSINPILAEARKFQNFSASP